MIPPFLKLGKLPHTRTNPKSGKESELVYIPKKASDRLRQYILQKNIKPDERIFPISYSAGRNIVKKTGLLVKLEVHPS